MTQSAGQASLSLLLPSSQVSPAFFVPLPQSGGCVVELVDVVVLLLVVEDDEVVDGPALVDDVVVRSGVLDVLLLELLEVENDVEDDVEEVGVAIVLVLDVVVVVDVVGAAVDDVLVAA